MIERKIGIISLVEGKFGTAVSPEKIAAFMNAFKEVVLPDKVECFEMPEDLVNRALEIELSLGKRMRLAVTNGFSSEYVVYLALEVEAGELSWLPLVNVSASLKNGKRTDRKIVFWTSSREPDLAYQITYSEKGQKRRDCSYRVVDELAPAWESFLSTGGFLPYSQIRDQVNVGAVVRAVFNSASALIGGETSEFEAPTQLFRKPEIQ